MTTFPPDYFTARARFRQMAAKKGGRIDALQLDARGPGGEDLTIDIAWFGTEKPRRALLHSSGLHGVEGFAGSAIQLQLLENLPAPAGDAAVVVVHVLNPFGMAWLRRVNENNVDLNRNYLDADAYHGAPAAYSKLDRFLNPPSSPSFDFFSARAGGLILRHGMAALRQAVVGGQYEYPKGLFFGGNQLEQGLKKYRDWIHARLTGVEKLGAIDVHTGLGKYGQDTLMEPLNGPPYAIRGGLPMIFAELQHTETTFVGQEFGTYGPLKVLHALREENRWHHHGAGTLAHPAKLRLKQAFCPDDEKWRQAVLNRARELLDNYFPAS